MSTAQAHTREGYSRHQTRNWTPAAVLAGLLAIAAGTVSAGSIIGRDIRCGAYLRGGGSETVRAIEIRKQRGDPVSSRDEKELLAGAELMGCSFLASR